MTKKDMSVILSGGGIKGLLYCGILKAYQELKYDLIYNIKQVIGISIGTVFALFWIIGYSWDELQEHLNELELDTFNEFNIELLFTKYGLNTGNNLINHIEIMMNKKNIDSNITLQEIQTKFQVNFGVIVTNLNKQCLEIISYKKNPNIRVLDAIRMAISIPLLFTAKRLNKDIYVDAALISNYPLDFITKYIENETVFGINIITNKSSTEIIDLTSYMKCIINCIRQNKNQQYNNIKTCNINCDLSNNLIYGNFTVNNTNEYINMGYNSFLETSFL